MPRKLVITLWLAIGLTIPIILILPLSIPGARLGAAAIWQSISGSILTLGMLIIYWTKKAITQVTLKRYLLLAGASAIGILFFQNLS